MAISARLIRQKWLALPSLPAPACEVISRPGNQLKLLDHVTISFVLKFAIGLTQFGQKSILKGWIGFIHGLDKASHKSCYASFCTMQIAQLSRHSRLLYSVITYSASAAARISDHNNILYTRLSRRKCRCAAAETAMIGIARDGNGGVLTDGWAAQTRYSGRPA
jgi:hypothetical protein